MKRYGELCCRCTLLPCICCAVVCCGHGRGSLLTVKDGERVREWLGRNFVRPMSKAGGDAAPQCVRALDQALGEDSDFDLQVRYSRWQGWYVCSE